jgi:hypothetical protein
MNERELYEQACRYRASACGRVYEAHYFARSGDGERYLNQSAEHGWQVWQSAREAPIASGWVLTSERLPEIDMAAAGYARYAKVLGWSEGLQPRQVRYTSNGYAKTEKGREPRWEEATGRITRAPTYWMPMPAAPNELPARREIVQKSKTITPVELLSDSELQHAPIGIDSEGGSCD